MLDKRMVVVSEAAVPLVPDRRETPTNIPIFGSWLCPVSEASCCCFVMQCSILLEQLADAKSFRGLGSSPESDSR